MYDAKSEPNEFVGESLHIEWMQFCLNEAEDNIRLLAPVSHLRQKGYATGEAFCSMGSAARTMNHWVMPTPVNEEGSEWLEGLRELRHILQVTANSSSAILSPQGRFDQKRRCPIPPPSITCQVP